MLALSFKPKDYGGMHTNPAKLIWRKVYWTWRKHTNHWRLSPLQRTLAREQDKTPPRIRPELERIRANLISHANEIIGPGWNDYSDALRAENVAVFDAAANATPLPGDYLEIGSANGLSMACIGSLLKGSRLVSLDPYFSEGYVEGVRGPNERPFVIPMGKIAKANARAIYERCGLSVELIEKDSNTGLRELICDGRSFDLIYIDGYHEKLQPTIDFGLCMLLLRPGGVIMLDDHLWPDVAPIKALCDTHLIKIAESWKIAAYSFPSAA